MNEATGRQRVSVVIPALNEEEPIAAVVRDCLSTNLPEEVIVVDNGSTDRTAERARAAGAKVVAEPLPGYGRACAAGVRAVSPECEIVVFLDGDGSDCPELMGRLVQPILERKQDFVIGSRTRGQRESGSMNFQQVFAGRIRRSASATSLRGSLYRYVPLPRDSAGGAGSARDEGKNLWMESRDADARGPRRTSYSGSAGESSLPDRRRIQSFGNAAWHLRCRVPDRCDAGANCGRAPVTDCDLTLAARAPGRCSSSNYSLAQRRPMARTDAFPFPLLMNQPVGRRVCETRTDDA